MFIITNTLIISYSLIHYATEMLFINILLVILYWKYAILPIVIAYLIFDVETVLIDLNDLSKKGLFEVSFEEDCRNLIGGGN